MTNKFETSNALYKAQEPVFPRRVSGPFRRLKWAVMAVTLGIYYLAPWIPWDRGTQLSDQAILVDLAHRRFYFFWIEIWPHEFYFVAGLLIMAGLGLFLFTSALGRVWCGYACPQTVWTDLFILVERWIEGDRNARLRLFYGKWTFRKWRLRITKWFVWILISFGTGGAWVFYFTDASNLARDLWSFDAHSVVYSSISILTLTTFVFGGFMREQICIYMCPWPRIQAAMMDTNTLSVAYRSWRGEPRGKMRQTGRGDCIDCLACVNVCPMGIDIRQGQQMECIACALCIDACDDVMAKIGHDRGLVDYLVLADEEVESAGGQPVSVWKYIFRPRTFLYALIWSSIGIGMIYALFIRNDIDMTIRPVRNPTYLMQSDGAIRNIYEARLRNKLGEARVFQLEITGGKGFLLQLQSSNQAKTITVPADSTYLQRFYITVPKDHPAAKIPLTQLRLWVEDIENGNRSSSKTAFNGAPE